MFDPASIGAALQALRPFSKLQKTQTMPMLLYAPAQRWLTFKED
jgi:hypothetical protein